MNEPFFGPEDICTHAGDEYARYLGAIVPPIFQNSLFTSKESSSGYSYTRGANPTVELTETKIAALEGARMDPHQAWLPSRGLRTFPLRMGKHRENARAIPGTIIRISVGLECVETIIGDLDQALNAAGSSSGNGRGVS